MKTMRNSGKPKKFINFRTQMSILLAIVTVTAIVFLVLFFIKRDAEYRSSLAAPLYDARTDTAQALERLGEGKAELVTRTEETKYKVKLAFSGVSSYEIMHQILDQLDQYDMKAVFYLSGVDAAESGDMVKELLARGHQLGTRALHGEQSLETMPQEALVQSLCEANAILRDVAGVIPGSLKSLNTDYTEGVLEAAYACGIKSAVDTPYNLDMLSFSSYSSVLRYINSRELGSIVSMNISEELEEEAKEEKSEEAKPAVDMQEELPPDTDHVDMNLLSDNEKILLISKWLIQANKEADYLEETVGLREQNGGALCEPERTIHTTKKAASYVFSGVSSDGELKLLLDALDEVDAKASFALTRDEANKAPEQLSLILSRGHEILPRLVLQKGNDYYTLCSRMLLETRYFTQTLECPDTGCIAILSEASAAAREAASAAGLNIVCYQNNLVQQEHKDETDPEKILSQIYGARLATFYLMRGQILRFDRGVYTNEATLGELVKAVSLHSFYSLEKATDILSDTQDLYTYPVPESEWLKGINDIKPGHYPTSEAQMDAIAHRYIGTPSARYSDNLPGFTDDERGRINRAGLVETKERVAFLTFDAWGSDASITKLLDVMEKHNVLGSFYVVSGYAINNPNLLRAIAQAGHDVGSHTNTHFQLAVDSDGDMVYSSLEPATLDALREDVLESWYTLASVIGDMEHEGVPSLTPILRPPTLSVSRESMGAVLDLGFRYIVSGSYSTHDYEEDDPEQLYRDIKANLKRGAIIVLHMSDTAAHTAEALELLFSYNESLPASKQYMFLPLSSYLDGSYTVTPAY